MTVKRQENLDQNRKDVLNQRRVKELMELEEDSKKVVVKDEEMAGRQSGKMAFSQRCRLLISKLFSLQRIFGMAYKPRGNRRNSRHRKPHEQVGTK